MISRASISESTAFAADLEPPQRRRLVVEEERRARVVPEVLHLDVAGEADDVEAAVAEAVPDRGEEHAAVAPVRREHRDEREREPVGELVERDVLTHRPILSFRLESRRGET